MFNFSLLKFTNVWIFIKNQYKNIQLYNKYINNNFINYIYYSLGYKSRQTISVFGQVLRVKNKYIFKFYNLICFTLFISKCFAYNSSIALTFGIYFS